MLVGKVFGSSGQPPMLAAPALCGAPRAPTASRVATAALRGRVRQDPDRSRSAAAILRHPYEPNPGPADEAIAQPGPPGPAGPHAPPAHPYKRAVDAGPATTNTDAKQDPAAAPYAARPHRDPQPSRGARRSRGRRR